MKLNYLVILAALFLIVACSEDDNDWTPPGPVSGFTATAGDNQAVLAWTNPTDGDFAGVMIRRDSTAAPATVADGVQIHAGPGDTFTNTGLTNGATYYYTIFAFDGVQNYSAGVEAQVALGHYITAASGSRAALDGDWGLGCAADSSQGSEDSVVTISGAALSQARDRWITDGSCTAPADYSSTTSATFVLGNQVTATLGATGAVATKMDLTITAAAITLNSADAVTEFNSRAICGFSDWVADTARDILGTECFSISSIKELLYIDDTGEVDTLRLSLDDDGAGESVLDADGYPTELETAGAPRL